MTVYDDKGWEELTPPTPQEVEQAQALREALEAGEDHPDADLLRSLRFLENPPPLEPRVNEWLVHRALHKMAPSHRGRWVASGVAAALALAAGVVIVLSTGPDPTTAPVVRASLVSCRSTQSLFHEPFDRHGGTSSRMDRIARDRARDYRTNLFLRGGVQP
jgi:hypothetical protein